MKTEGKTEVPKLEVPKTESRSRKRTECPKLEVQKTEAKGKKTTTAEAPDASYCRQQMR